MGGFIMDEGKVEWLFVLLLELGQMLLNHEGLAM